MTHIVKSASRDVLCLDDVKAGSILFLKLEWLPLPQGFIGYIDFIDEQIYFQAFGNLTTQLL
jgi:hypothetical protein